MKNIGILGSTGSIGKQTLDVISNHPEKFNVRFLAANSNAEILVSQCNKFNPEFVCIYDESKYQFLKKNTDVKNILCGHKGLIDLCELSGLDVVLNAIVGYKGLEPTIKIIESGTDIALSNKESIVQAGHIVMKLAKLNNVNIFPVDSEHSALWQCLVGEENNQIKKIILTASGGPFRTLPKNEFDNITVSQALNHPNWSMGNKISIDSATMMNKGFEMIEAFWLFNVSPHQIQIVVHPQSIIHSMIEYIDGSIKAQLSTPNMKIPIQYALSYPERYKLPDFDFNIKEFSNLELYDVDMEKFSCIALAFDAIKKGGSNPVVLNVANDLAVELFLNKKIKFNQIPELIKDAMNNHKHIDMPSLSDILSITKSTENYINSRFKS